MAKGGRRAPGRTAGVVLLAAFALLVLAWLGPGTAHSAFPGENGRIAFTRQSDEGAYHIWMVNPDGAHSTRLTCGDGVEPAWSPDGRRIAFWGDGALWTVNADGRNPARLTDGSMPVWSPTSERIAVVRTFTAAKDSYSMVYVVKTDGSDGVHGGVHMAGESFLPAQPWSPDGTRLALGDSIYDADTGESRAFAESAAWTFEDQPAWSSRDVIAFSRRVLDSPPSIWRVNPDGSEQTRLTDGPETAAWSLWSPDGERIAFQRSRERGIWELWVMDADGSDQTRLAAEVDFLSYAWSPDGQRIAFRRAGDLWVAGADGNDQRRLARGDAGVALDYVWSPDGRRIAFSLEDHVWTVNADGGDRTLLAERASRPDWQPLPVGNLGPPPSQFCFEGLRRNTKRGFARLVVEVPRPGRVILQRRAGVRRFVQVHQGEGNRKVALRVRPRGKARQRLNRQARRTGRGRVRVRAQVTYNPWVGERHTKGRRVWLVQR